MDGGVRVHARDIMSEDWVGMEEVWFGGVEGNMGGHDRAQVQHTITVVTGETSGSLCRVQ